MSAQIELAGYGWNWKEFRGTRPGLKYNNRDLATLDLAMSLARGRTAAVQAGGNLGIFPKRLAQEFQTVYTFEPDPTIFPLLCYNAPERNIVKLQAAVGERAGLVGVVNRRRTDGLKPNHEGTTHVSGNGVLPVLRIDDLGLEVCELLVLDTEGYELFALRGALQMIDACRPIVMVEVNQNIGFFGISREDVHELLRSKGYKQAHARYSDFIYVPGCSAS